MPDLPPLGAPDPKQQNLDSLDRKFAIYILIFYLGVLAVGIVIVWLTFSGKTLDDDNPTLPIFGLLCGGPLLLVGVLGLLFWIVQSLRGTKPEVSLQALAAAFPPAFKETLALARGLGILLTAASVATWCVYAAGKTDVGAAVGASIIALFSVPLMIGSMMVLGREPAGLWLLKFGALPFVVLKPGLLIRFWRVDSDPEFRQFMFGPGDQEFD